MDTWVGQTISHYRVLEKIGQGGMGEVYLARDTALDRQVALKFLSEEMEADEMARNRFLREARYAAAIDHPFVCNIFEVGETDGKAFLALEYIQGQTLRDKLVEGSLPLAQALKTATEISEALEEAHRRGIIHRDLKPSNIMMTADGHVKVMDFGLAKRVGSDGAGSQRDQLTSLTKEGSLVGTVPYMSPEQLKGQQVDTRSDIFSFGIILYQMLTGVHPFIRADAMETASAILKEIPSPLARYLDNVSPLLDHTIHKLLAKEPESRYQVIHDVKINLKDVLDEVEHISLGEVGVVPGRAGAKAVSGEIAWWRSIPFFLASVVIAAALAALLSWNLKPSRAGPVVRTQIDVQPARQLGGGVDPEFSLELRVGRNRPSRTALALSLDGSKLVFRGIGENGTQLDLREMGSMDSLPIPGSEGGYIPVISPDEEWIAFATLEEGDFHTGTWKWNKLSIKGGRPLALCDGITRIFGASWGSNGLIIFDQTDGGLWKVSDTGGQPEALTVPDKEKGESEHVLPQILPDGEAVLFTIRGQTARDKTQILDQLEVTGKAVPVLSDVMQALNCGTFSINGHAALFDFSNNGTLAYVSGGVCPDVDYRIELLDRKGEARSLTPKPFPYFVPRISPDGKKLVYRADRQAGLDLFLFDMASGRSTQLTFEDAPTAQQPLWTPDGRQITYSHRLDMRFEILLIPPDRSAAPKLLFESDNGLHPSSWSPAGDKLAYVETHPANQNDIWVLQMEDEERIPIAVTEASEGWPVFSPNGKWIAYASNQSGEWQIYVQPFPPTGRIEPVSIEGGVTAPIWGPDGRELFYRGHTALWGVDVATKPDFTAGQPRVLFEYEPSIRLQAVRNYDITPDGLSFILTKELQQESTPVTRINIVQNWFEELKRFAPTGN